MPHRLMDSMGRILAVIFTAYVLAMKTLEDVLPIMRRYRFRFLRRKHRRLKRGKQAHSKDKETLV